MDLVISLVSECLNELEKRHNVTAGYLADAAYVLSMSKRLPINMQKKLRVLTYDIDYSNFAGAKKISAEILETMVLI